MVRDKGVVGYLDFGSIEITLTDVNDNGPVFSVVRIKNLFNTAS